MTRAAHPGRDRAGSRADAGRRPLLPARLPRHPGARRARQRNHRPASPGSAVAVWLAGRWMVTPLARLSAQVDKVAGGDLTIAVPRSRIGEIANIAQAVEGMTAALGETAQRRAEADEARRFLVTSIAHDLRTPLFALRGHLQAIGSRLGRPGRPPRAGRSESRRARTTDRQPVRLHPRRLRPTSAPARSRPGRRPAPTRSRPASSTRPASETTRSTSTATRRSASSSTATASNAHSPTSSTTRSATAPPGAPIHLSWAAADDVDRRRSPSTTTDPESTPTSSRTSSNPASAEPRQPAAPTAAPGSASRSQNASSNTSTPPSPSDNHPAGGAVISLTLRRAPSATPPVRPGD